ncbi:MAG: Mur ligase family protein [Patescibacteria group bacterium]
MFDINKCKKVYIVGIKGVGSAALAEMLKSNGYDVSGSDIDEEFLTDIALKHAGISVFKFGEGDFKGVDAIVRSVAYNQDNNIDIKKAYELKIPIFTYPEVVSYFFNSVFGIAVVGSHGKTTTTAMLADILYKSGLNLNSIVGSVVNDWGSGSKTNNLNRSDAVFVLEADEYREAFLNYKSKGAIITNIDYDHPDCYKTEDEYKFAFLKFAESIQDGGFLVVNKDDKNLLKIVKDLKCKVIFFGKDNLKIFHLKIPGEHNIMNANAAFLAALELGVSESDAKKYLEEFNGTARRFEVVGKIKDAVIVDDYAHHPSEIKATLRGAREVFPDKKLVAIFQPHTYSRTKIFFNDFIEALKLADEVVLTDIFSSARESFDGSVSIKNMSDSIGDNSFYIQNKDDIAGYCKKYLIEDVVIIFMGAGDIWQSAKMLCGSR